MSTILTGLNNFAFTYLDDILVFSQMYEDHLHHLDVVFEKFQKAGLKIKLSKCQFFKSHLHYLGHRISANNLEPLPEKLKAYQEPSTSQKHRQSMSHPQTARILQVICSSFCQYHSANNQSIKEKYTICMVFQVSTSIRLSKGNLL